jgi:hypothetical protein
MSVQPDTKCVNAHDLCWQGGPCPYCQTTAWRDNGGRYAKSPHEALPHGPLTTAEVLEWFPGERDDDYEWFHDSDMESR